jgi:hypothetical protein
VCCLSCCCCGCSLKLSALVLSKLLSSLPSMHRHLRAGYLLGDTRSDKTGSLTMSNKVRTGQRSTDGTAQHSTNNSTAQHRMSCHSTGSVDSPRRAMRKLSWNVAR